MIYRWLRSRCKYCGRKKIRIDSIYDMLAALYRCPTDYMEGHGHIDGGCSNRKIFITFKEAKVQRALGLLETE